MNCKPSDKDHLLKWAINSVTRFPSLNLKPLTHFHYHEYYTVKSPSLSY